MSWSRFQKKHTTCVKTMLKHRNMVKYQLEAGPGAAALDIEDDDIVIESKPASSSTPSGERRVAMSKLFKEIPPLCSVHDVDSRHLVAERKLGVGDDLAGEVDFGMVELLYNLQRNRKHDHAKYDLFRSNDMNDIAEVLGDAMKLGAHANVLCSTLQFAVLCRAFLFRKMEEQDST